MSIEENIREFGFDAMNGAEMARRLRNCSELWAAGDRWDEAFIESIARWIESHKSILDALDAAEKALATCEGAGKYDYDNGGIHMTSYNKEAVAIALAKIRALKEGK